MNKCNQCCPPCTPCCECSCMPIICPTGPTGPQGVIGPTGPQGPAGQSAFEAAQQGGYTGTQSAFYTSLANISNAILSTTIRANDVVTMAQYQNLISLGQIDPHTAYDIIEEQV